MQNQLQNERNKYNFDKCTNLRKLIVLRAASEYDELNIQNIIHEQLVGNMDYIDSRIILNDSSTRKILGPEEEFKGEVHIYIFNDSETDPDFIIPTTYLTEMVILNNYERNPKRISRRATDGEK